jgi:hypothetical protein
VWPCGRRSRCFPGYTIIVIVQELRRYKKITHGVSKERSSRSFSPFSEKQVRRIISEYVEYYNYQRMHQGINKIPDAEIIENSGKIKKVQILSGLHHHYYRSSA